MGDLGAHFDRCIWYLVCCEGSDMRRLMLGIQHTYWPTLEWNIKDFETEEPRP